MAAVIVGILLHIETRTAQKLEDMNLADKIVAVDGGVLSRYSLYRDLLCEAVKDISGKRFSKTFRLKRTEGGAGFGIAVLASASYKYNTAK